MKDEDGEVHAFFWVFVNVLMVLALGFVPERPRVTVDDLRFGLPDLQFPGVR